MPNKFKISKLLVLFLACIIAPLTFAADYWQMNMYKGVTPISRDIYDLHMIAIYVCAGIGVIVFGAMIYALIYHRKSRGYVAADFHENFTLEVVWSIIPFIILIGLAIPATKVLINMNNDEDSDLTIKVVGYQWKWRYQYLDQGISYYSVLSTPYTQINNQEPKNLWYLLEVDKPLIVPINKKIRFLVTSNDVVHSWWVPELGIKRDAIPGFMHEAWAKISKPGTYRGQCAELCGVNHGFMPIVVKAVSEDKFNEWVASQPKVSQNITSNAILIPKDMSREDLMRLGKEKYETNCAACHQSDGKGIPPMFPALKGSSVAVGHPIKRHIDTILYGVPGTAMQPYGEQLTDEEIAAIATYERNAWDNNTNDEIQPQEVNRIRNEAIVEPKIVEKAQSGRIE